MRLRVCTIILLRTCRTYASAIQKTNIKPLKTIIQIFARGREPPASSTFTRLLLRITTLGSTDILTLALK
jgi:hypothetical protein